jgi:hypothetical protein
MHSKVAKAFHMTFHINYHVRIKHINGIDDKSNELIEPPSIATNDKQKYKCGKGLVNNLML